MIPLIEHLRGIIGAHLGKPADTRQIIETQQELVKNRNAPIPEDFLNFLRHCNGFTYDGATIFGVFPTAQPLQNIALATQMSPFARQAAWVVLGADEFDYLAYNAKCRQYQIIDKEDLEVLEEYSDIKPAILHILKI